MSKRKANCDSTPNPEKRKASLSSTVVESQNETFPQISLKDTEVALTFIKRALADPKRKDSFPPVSFVHQLYDVVNSKTVVNRQLVSKFILESWKTISRNHCKLPVIHFRKPSVMKRRSS